MKTFLNSIGFLTIVKIPQRLYLKSQIFWKITYYFPLTGLIIGILMSAFYLAAQFIFPSFACVIIVLGLEVLLTGAMHLDGLSDTIDGVFCGETDKSKILEIMKKSDIGVFGVLSLIFLFALKFTFFYLLIMLGNDDIYSILIFIAFMPAFGRWTINYNFSTYGKSKRSGSLANAFISGGNKKVFGVSTIYLFYLIIFQALIFGFFIRDKYFLNFSGLSLSFFKNSNMDLGLVFILAPLTKIVTLVILIYLSTAMLSRFFLRKIGNLSGDGMGAIVEISEVIFLFLSYICVKFI
ncbi:MAG: adenosylcobinamide-GDP ribazoletransferase [Candidatus Humimicrobiaceae bacterium]